MAVGFGGGATALRAEQGCGLIVCRQKSLGLAWGLEPAHDLLASSRVSVRRFAAIVEALVLAMLEAGRHLGLCCRVGSKLVGHHDAWWPPAFQKFAQEPLGGDLVPPGLDQNVEHVAVRVDRAPQPVGAPP